MTRVKIIKLAIFFFYNSTVCWFLFQLRLLWRYIEVSRDYEQERDKFPRFDVLKLYYIAVFDVSTKRQFQFFVILLLLGIFLPFQLCFPRVIFRFLDMTTAWHYFKKYGLILICAVELDIKCLRLRRENAASASVLSKYVHEIYQGTVAS